MKASTTLIAAGLVVLFASFASAQIRFGTDKFSVELGGGTRGRIGRVDDRRFGPRDNDGFFFFNPFNSPRCGNDPIFRPRDNRPRREVASSEYSRLLGLEVIETRAGLEVVDVDRRSPADDADIRVGDVIVEIEGRNARDLRQLEDEAEDARGGIFIIVESNGREFELELEL